MGGWGGANLISSTPIVSLWLWEAVKAESIFLLQSWGRLAETGLVSIWGIMNSLSFYTSPTLAAGPLFISPVPHTRRLSLHRNVEAFDGSSFLIMFSSSLWNLTVDGDCVVPRQREKHHTEIANSWGHTPAPGENSYRGASLLRSTLL